MMFLCFLKSFSMTGLAVTCELLVLETENISVNCCFDEDLG